MKEDIYDSGYIDELVENDEIDSKEAGIMFWYDKEMETERISEIDDIELLMY